MKKSFVILLLIMLCSWTCVGADTIKADGFKVEFTPPQGWISSAEYSMSEQEELLGLPHGQLKLRSELMSTTWLYYPVDGKYSLDDAIQINVSPMESYHQDYSGYDEAQLGNIARSYMKDGKVASYETLQTPAGHTFLRMNYVQTDSNRYACFYVTHANGGILRAEIPAALAEDPAVMQWLESIVIRENDNALLDFLAEYWYIISIFVIGFLGAVAKSRGGKEKKTSTASD